MKNALIRIDAGILKVLTAIVRSWVARHEFKKHKIDLLIRVEWIMLGAAVLWATIIPAVLYAVSGSSGAGGIHLLMWGVLASSDYFSVQMTIRQIKPFHDFLFGMRENPAVYEAQKMALEEGFVRHRRRRFQLMAIMIGALAACVSIDLILGIDAPTSFVLQYLTLNTIVAVFKQYLLYVFDFDPPKKKKKASEAITDLVRRLWGEFIGGFNPLPVPVPV